MSAPARLGPRLRRFEQPHTRATGDTNALPPDHPSAREGYTRYHAMVRHPYSVDRVLKSGVNSRKIGSRVTKGAWKGMPIYTLTLEERATCPRSCAHWLDCYGNKMHWSQRIVHGPMLEAALANELATLQGHHPAGFVVRLHVLGDFYSVDYVQRWAGWLGEFPAVRVFGYTAWPPDTAIGATIQTLRDVHWDRFAVRTSQPTLTRTRLREATTTTVYSDAAAQQQDGIVCPQQRNQTDCCGTCALCWGTRRNIVFLAH